ncbi:carbohydrate porin, partial [Rhodovastum atsumiense]
MSRSLLALLLASVAALPALAQTPLPAAPETREQQPLGAGPQTGAEPEKGFWEREHMLGDLGGLRSRLEDAGVTLTLQETSEVLGNVSGG